jgi:hypothetical protein
MKIKKFIKKFIIKFLEMFLRFCVLTLRFSFSGYMCLSGLYYEFGVTSPYISDFPDINSSSECFAFLLTFLFTVFICVVNVNYSKIADGIFGIVKLLVQKIRLRKEEKIKRWTYYRTIPLTYSEQEELMNRFRKVETDYIIELDTKRNKEPS